MFSQLTDLKFSASNSLKPTRLSFWNSGEAVDDEEGSRMTTRDSRCMAVLAELPFLVSFSDRVKVCTLTVVGIQNYFDNEEICFMSSLACLLDISMKRE